MKPHQRTVETFMRSEGKLTSSDTFTRESMTGHSLMARSALHSCATVSHGPVELTGPQEGTSIRMKIKVQPIKIYGLQLKQSEGNVQPCAHVLDEKTSFR